VTVTNHIGWISGASLSSTLRVYTGSRNLDSATPAPRPLGRYCLVSLTDGSRLYSTGYLSRSSPEPTLTGTPPGSARRVE